MKMQNLTSEEFEALWQKAQTDPVVPAPPRKAVQIDLSLSRILDQYVRLADQYLAEGEIEKTDHDALIEAVGKLKPILNRIGDKALVRKDTVRRAEVRRSRIAK